MMEEREMLFTVELRDIGPRFRLQNDRAWRDLSEGMGLKESDLTCATPSEVTALSAAEGVFRIEGKAYDVGLHRYPSEHDQLHYSSRLFRRDYPQEPDADQLKRGIASGDDSKNNCPILNVYGKFELRPSPPFNQLVNDPSIVVRHETFDAGNDYVGHDASEDEELVNGIFVSSLEYWRNHLRYHTTQEYSDIPATQTIEAIREDLARIRKHWRPYN